MMLHATCPQGHRWELTEPPVQAPVCPVCGANGVVPERDLSVLLLPDFETNHDNRTLPWIPESDPPTEVVAPSQVPGYELLGELGRGGMGVVYLARQLRLNRFVALKLVLFGGHAGTVALSRFRAEAETLAQLQHPNIVQIFEIDEHDGLPFISLEYCAGGSLEQRLRQGPITPRDAATLVETLARAIHAAHERGVVHRDLKPANLLFQRDGSLRITDFGLAKKLDNSQRLTATGSVLGTPGYMAPEQASGRVQDIGPASDVFSLGAIFYECLTGKQPFEAATPLETVLLVLQEEPTPPRTLDPDLPADLETICLKAMNKDISRRYPSAQAMADDLARFLRGEPILARPRSVSERLLQCYHRNRLLTGLSLAVLGLLVLVGVLLLVLLQRSPVLPDSSEDDPSLQTILASGVLRIATDPTYPPMEYRKDGKVVGFDIDLGEQLAQHLGVRVEWHHVTWDWKQLVERLNAGEFDLILSGITIEEDRLRDVDFVQYLQIQQVFVCRRGIDVRRWSDLAGKVVAVQQDTPPHRNVLQAQREGQSIRCKVYPDTPSTFEAVARGEADVAFAFKSVAEYLRRNDPHDRLVVTAATDHSLEQHGVGMALRKTDRSLRSRLESEVAALKRDRIAWTRFLTSYFGD